MSADNTLDFIMSYEQGDLGAEATVRGFAKLVETGLAWKLQGHYGRTAAGLIEAGLLDRTGKVDEDELAAALEGC